MNDETNSAAPLTPRSAEFLARHAETGTPSAEQLAQVRLKLATATATPRRPGDVVSLPSRRAFLPVEVLAVAAVVLLGVVGQFTWLWLKKDVPTMPPVESGSQAVVAAYRTGDLRGAQRLAAGSSCTDAVCTTLAAQLLRALELAHRLETLQGAELDELTALDVALSGGQPTELTDALARRRARVVPRSDTTDAREVYLRAYQLKESSPDDAIRLFQQVLTLVPPEDVLAVKAKIQLERAGFKAPVPGATNLAPPESIELKSGERRTLTWGGRAIERVALGDPNVVSADTFEKDSLQLTGAAPGTTTLLLWLSTGERVSHTVTVTK